MADLKKFLDSAGVGTLWGRVLEELKKEADRAEAAEKLNKAAAEAAAAAAKAAQDDVDALELYVGTIPSTYTENNIVAFIQKRAEEVLAAAQGGSSETAASVKGALDAYIALNDPIVSKNTTDIATIMGDYLKASDKTELSGLISTNAGEITRIDNALKAALENEGEGLDSIKELATWIEEHGEDAAGYAAAIQALEDLVGDETVATQIATAIAEEHLEQYAKTSDIQGTLNKVDTQGTVTAAISAAIDALKIGDYAKAADLAALATRVTTVETTLANGDYQNSTQVASAVNTAIANLKAENLWDAKGAAATAQQNAEAYADSLASNYATAAQGEKADSALQSSDIVTGSTNGSIRVKGTDVAVKGLGSAAYTESTAYDAAGSAAQALVDAKAYTVKEINEKVIALTEAEINAAINAVSSN